MRRRHDEGSDGEDGGREADGDDGGREQMGTD